MTTPIAKNPTRVFPQVVDWSSRTDTATRRRCSPTASASATASLPRAPTATRAGRWRKASRKGDTVCLLMPNRPEYLAIWVGITRVGGVVALINTNLIGTALAHCINIVEPKHIIVAAELLGSLETARAHITGDAQDLAARRMPTPISRASIARSTVCPAPTSPASERLPLTIEDRALYIYTSGTTGLPKAANINHYRVMLASHAFAGVMDTQRQRPHVRLPADVSHRRRRWSRPARCWSAAARW